MSEAARVRRHDPDFEPPFGSAPQAPASSDPLAELARLVGQDDSFRGVFKQTSPAPARAVAAAPSAEPVHHRPAPQSDRDPRAEEAQPDYSEEPSPATQAMDPVAFGHDPYEDEAAETLAYAEQHPYAAHEDGAAQGAEDYSVPSDSWDGTSPDHHAETAPPSQSDESAPIDRAPRRPLAVLFAVLALTGGGLAATFLARSGSGAMHMANGGTPTIMASTAPSKIQQVDPSAPTNAEDAESALLSKSGENGTGPVKVVKSQEQPLDLAQLPKSASASESADAVPASRSPFPEPKKVKTFVVRSDGSVIGNSAAGQPAPSSLAQVAAAAVADSPAAIAPAPGPTVAPRPVTPRGGQVASSTPRAPSGQQGTDATSTVARPRQAATPGPKPAAKPKPVEVADASESATPVAQGGGSFALQLAASPSEQDAREAFSKLQRKHSELSGFKPSVRKFDNGDKSVYRLRVGNLSQDQAKTLCSQLQASGGSCFVVRN